MDEVKVVDTNARKVFTQKRTLDYDYLVLATGSDQSFLVHEEWRRYAPGLKSVEDAIAQGLEMLRLAGDRLPRLVDELERVVDMRKVEALRRVLPGSLHPDHRYDYKQTPQFLGMKPSSVKSIPAVDLPRAAPGRIEGIDLMAYRGRTLPTRWPASTSTPDARRSNKPCD